MAKRSKPTSGEKPSKNRSGKRARQPNGTAELDFPHRFRDGIFIHGARVHNLQNVDVKIPRNKLVVVTGVSGSGKSSLTMDTLYAEGQRRYVESLSAYARQFLMRMSKPDVDRIDGLCPAIALEQKVTTRTTRSTVGSMTEVYDYLRLLYARTGRTYSPVSGNEVRRHEVTDIVDFVSGLESGSRVQLAAPLQHQYDRPLETELDVLMQKGYVRMLRREEEQWKPSRIEDLLETGRDSEDWPEKADLMLLVDRFVAKSAEEDDREEFLARIADSAEIALFESYGDCVIVVGEEHHHFSTRFELDGIQFEIPSDHFFNYNNPFGACKRCEGFGSIIGIDPDLVIPDKSKSVYDGAIVCWRGAKMKSWLDRLIRNAGEFDFPIHRPVSELSDAEYQLLWEGNAFFRGLHQFFRHLEAKAYKIQYRVMLARYRGRTPCTECGGSRLRKDTNYVKVGEKAIAELLTMPIEEVYSWSKELELGDRDAKIAHRLLVEVRQRLGFMLDVGLGYLTLGRKANTLSGGETQRINLTRQLGSNLTSSLYILDEPSVGLHPRDTARLVRVLHRLRDLGNTVVVVEHEEDVMTAADHIIDMGPRAGVHGGTVTAEGPYEEILTDNNSLTGAYLSEREKIEVPAVRRRVVDKIRVKGARQFNLKNIDVEIPLNMLVSVTGVSGSGKTTLVKKILVPALQQALMDFGEKPGDFDGIEGDYKRLHAIEMVDQNPIGKSSRSNPVTYVKAYDAIRELYARQPGSKIRGFQPRHFSFNVDGGRCDNCKGEGETVVEMQFLADVRLVCEDCGGKRFKSEIIEVKYGGKSIDEVLELTVDEALAFFSKEKEIVKRLSPLSEVGLGYVHLGQSASTLSGGEAQRVKLASFLGKGRSAKPVLFVFDEPTTGLHFHDIRKLLKAFEALVERGHSVLVVEHNMEVIKSSDWVIDLGPEGGDGGGQLVAAGTPEKVASAGQGYTGQFLAAKLG